MSDPFAIVPLPRTGMQCKRCCESMFAIEDRFEGDFCTCPLCGRCDFDVNYASHPLWNKLSDDDEEVDIPCYCTRCGIAYDVCCIHSFDFYNGNIHHAKIIHGLTNKKTGTRLSGMPVFKTVQSCFQLLSSEWKADWMCTSQGNCSQIVTGERECCKAGGGQNM